MSYLIYGGDLSSISLSENDERKSILQNIAVLLATRQGTVPMYREFGIPMLFLDKPLEVAKTLMVSEITAAINDFEPRVNVVGITFETDKTKPGRIMPIVEVEISDEQEY